MHITTRVVSSNTVQICEWLGIGRLFSPGTPVGLTDKTDRHDINEILSKVGESHETNSSVFQQVQLFIKETGSFID